MGTPSFNPIVSFYPNTWASDKGQNTALRLILAGVLHGRWQDFITRVRAHPYKSEPYEEAKKRLPAFTACATFLPGTRELSTVATLTYLVGLDFDEKDNPGKLAWARRQLEHDHYTWCCAASAGGQGIFVLVRVSVNAATSEWFDDLKDYYRLVYGLKVDSGCRDVTRLRYISYDPNLHLNDNASVYTPAPLLPERPRVISPTQLAAAKHYADGIDSAFDLEACVREVERRRTDITADGGRWVALGYALAGVMGESGRSYFHRLSCFHPRYRPGQTDRKYDGCLKKPSKVSIAKVFFLMREHGVEPVRRDALAA
jgi:hypothetical protein